MQARGMRGIRFTQFDPKTAATTLDMIEPLAKRVEPLGLHVQIHLRGDQIVGAADLLQRLPGTVVFDHLGRLSAAGIADPAFGVIRRMLDKGNTWMKLSGAYMFDGPPCYAKAAPIAQAYIEAAPERMVWGSDWPHPTEGNKPDDAVLFDLCPNGRRTRRCASASWSTTRQRCTVSKTIRRNVMDIKPLGSQPSRKTPAEYFTGTVWQDPIIEAPEPARLRAGLGALRAGRAHGVAHPSARPDHPHHARRRPRADVGRADQARSAPATRCFSRRARSTGTAPRPNTAMTHLAMQEALDGKHVTWMEKVTDEQYGGKPA